ncbi:diguanylate cyclase [Pseudorhodoferax sp. Leaf274]|uniref:GGDEF domain-containing protein n=1 Tax=Pseudorhodoferax sp. Leaf274 TaxID=1736318 RepID=UPI000702C265|nr:GGDEF domain-containing protein [Pseudorhodoferax sp. Leaf274]KQP36242.1 hypothetical protein ASF44_16915 [Pseudorhodoferax sp. Leaf274]
MFAPPLPTETTDTPYGQQLRAGFRWLRFAPALEAEYRAASLQGLSHLTLVAGAAGMAVWLVFIGMDFARLDLVARFPHWPAPLWRLAAIRALVLLVFVVGMVALWRGHHPRQRVLVAGMLFLLTLGGAAAIAIYLELRQSHDNWVLALVMIAVFLPLGLGFFEAAAVALACTGAVAVLGAVLPQADAAATLTRLAILMLVAGVAGATSAYMREYAQRGQFLLLHELRWQASRDALTGLFNRRVFTAALDAARQREAPALLVMLDVDHFKLYNDTCGHQAGDLALQRLARALDRIAPPPHGQAFRTGGEEMCLLLHGATAQDAVALGARMLQEVRALGIAHAASATTDRLSVSAGCALLAPDESAASLCRRADQLLYEAKARGRNCVVLDPALGGRVLYGPARQRDLAAAA